MSILEVAAKKLINGNALNSAELLAVVAACQAVIAMHSAFEKIIMIDTGELLDESDPAVAREKYGNA